MFYEVKFALLITSSWLQTPLEAELNSLTMWRGIAQIISLRKHAYSNILKNLQPKKKENFQIKNSDIFDILAQNIDFGYSLEPSRWGGSNEYTQSMFFFFSKIRKIMYTPVNPSLLYKSGV